MSFVNGVYLFADRVFYDHVARWERAGDRFDVTERVPPAGWRRHEHGPWVSLRPAGAVLPDQGWKVHVTARPENAARVGQLVWDYCVQHGLAFKFLRNRNIVLAHSSKYMPRAASGKFATIYPQQDQAGLRQVLTELGDKLAGESGPYLLSDLRWGKGPLFVRFGGFTERLCVAEDGSVEHAIVGPDGVAHPDRRNPVFELPPWVPLPDFLAPHQAARRDVSGGNLPYRVTKALQFTNGGGVYLATRLTDGASVVLKEARPMAGLDSGGTDAVVRLRRERWALAQLAGLAGVPAYHDYLTVGEHEFLVEEHIDGQTLSSWLVRTYPLALDADPTPQRLAGYTARVLAIHQELADLVARIHARGVVYGDLHPNNVVVRPDGSLALVDFELAHGVAEDADGSMWTPGFTDTAATGVARDRHSVAATGLWLFLPLNRMLALAPERIDEYLDVVAGRFPVPGEHLAQLRRALARGPASGPASGPAAGGAALVVDLADPAVDWDAAQRSMAAAIRLAATPARPDRLFPGDVEQFTEDALGIGHGTGGTLWALSVTGQGRYPDHEQWLRDAFVASRPARPGFYDGQHGYAYLADHFGWEAEVGRLVEQAAAGTSGMRAVDLYSGLAGAGLNLLHFAGRTGEAQFLDEARAVAKRVAEALDRAGGDDPALPARNQAGLMRGWSGPALFFLHLADQTGDHAYVDLAVRAVHRDLDCCVPTSDGGLRVADAIPLRSLAVGSAGIALVIDELLDQVADDRSQSALPQLVRACSTEYVNPCHLFRGRAGQLAAVSRVAHRLPGDLRPVLSRHLRRLSWHAVSYRGHLAFPGDKLLRLSMGLATGTAGVLLSVHAATASAAGFLPFFTPRAGWCGWARPAAAS